MNIKICMLIVTSLTALRGCTTVLLYMRVYFILLCMYVQYTEPLLSKVSSLMDGREGRME
jgi:hypothetical protein